MAAAVPRHVLVARKFLVTRPFTLLPFGFITGIAEEPVALPKVLSCLLALFAPAVMLASLVTQVLLAKNPAMPTAKIV